MNTFKARQFASTLLVLPVLLLALSGCSLFETSSEVRPPAELSKISAEIAPAQIWKVSVGKGAKDEYFKLAPMHSDDQMLTVASDGQLSAWDKTRGVKIWSIATKLQVATGANGSPNTVLVGGTSGNLNAYQVSDGELLWTRDLKSEIAAISAARDDQAVVRTKNGYIHSIALADGETRWSINREIPALSLHTQSTPLFHDDKVIIGLDNGRLLALSADDGKVLWERAVASGRGRSELDRMVDIDGRIIVENDIAYVATFQGNLAAINVTGGDVIWTQEASSVTGVATDEDRVFFTDSDDVVSALDKFLGESFWTNETLQYRRLTVPVVHGDYIVAADFEGYLHWFAKDDGRVVARKKVGAGVITEPFVIDNQLYVLDTSGNLSVWRVPLSATQSAAEASSGATTESVSEAILEAVTESESVRDAVLDGVTDAISEDVIEAAPEAVLDAVPES